jgi:hypothetical protein
MEVKSKRRLSTGTSYQTGNETQIEGNVNMDMK